MNTLKEIILVKYAARFINETLKRSLLNSPPEIWIKIIRERLSAFDIPWTLKNEIITLLKPMALEVKNWRADHKGIFTMLQEWSTLKFCFNADGTLNRIKTADSLIRSKRLGAETRFVLACQYWSSQNVFNVFGKIRNTLRNELLWKYSRQNENFNEHEKNVVKWIVQYRAGSSFRFQPWGHFTDASLQSRRLNDLSELDCRSLLFQVFEDTNQMHVGRFCLSRMSADHREQLLALYPLKVLRIYLFRPYHQFFMETANKVWDLLSGKDFTRLLHIIICQKIVALWTDFDYVGLLRQFWHRSPNHLKQYVQETYIFEILMEIVKNGFPLKEVPKLFSYTSPFFYV
ncbi:uncharacterized protein TNCT_652331 [Trichonephila clavata]|uniref:Uncharacterized protein n=1 Tax=Trichonephila clavata TaxID=2740835 RepID=A0A8X6KH53_TRICU|nr:uncharacterized protein TNCT_652331 [Trichonephila clavata]